MLNLPEQLIVENAYPSLIACILVSFSINFSLSFSMVIVTYVWFCYRLMSRKGGAKPDHKDLSENMAATHCLSHMITECKKLFQVTTF